jgi:non-heme Fe2+,alpha-ketoglutarate-dependent halogenase
MSKLLTHTQCKEFREDGLTFPIPVLSPEEVSHYRAGCERLEAMLGGKPRTIELRQMHLHFRWAFELATQTTILDAVEDILGPDLLVWATELFAKHARDEHISIGWHRDRPYMGFTGPVVTAWVALTDSELANGCMRAVPRSAESSDEAPQNSRDVILRSGEMSLHDPDLWHGSGPNRSGTKRIGFVIRYVCPESGPVGDAPPALLVRGENRRNRFQLLSPPAETSEDQALMALRDSASRHLEAVLGNLRQSQQ